MLCVVEPKNERGDEGWIDWKEVVDDGGARSQWIDRRNTASSDLKDILNSINRQRGGKVFVTRLKQLDLLQIESINNVRVETSLTRSVDFIIN